MSDYTPTTEQVRAFALGFGGMRSPEHWENWLAAHDREVARRARRKAHRRKAERDEARAEVERLRAAHDLIRTLPYRGADLRETVETFASMMDAEPAREHLPVKPDREAVRLAQHRALMPQAMSIFAAVGGTQADYDALLDTLADAVLALWTGESRATVQAEALREKAGKRLAPLHPLGDRWKPGERVESVFRRGPYGPEETRPGTVERIERTYGYHESLVIRFDDGEVRGINPDVMRHIRSKPLNPKGVDHA